MVDRVSALDGHYQIGHFGIADHTGVTFHLERDLQLHQLAVWPGMSEADAAAIRESFGVDVLPAPCRSSESAIRGQTASLLRIEPLKFWLVGGDMPELRPELGASLDLSHSRTQIDISGDDSATLLNRLLPLDLRDANMSAGAVASSAIHHVGITLWCRRSNLRSYSLFIPRGFAVSVWEVLMETAVQFGVEVE